MTRETLLQPGHAAATRRFAGDATFMRAPRREVSADVDIALAGVPFEVGVNYRAGVRQGPAAVREASRVIRRVHPVSGIAPGEVCTVADVGDAPVDPLDFNKSIAMIEEFFAGIRKAGASAIAVGGDHTVSLPILRAIAREEAVGIVQIDSHSDTLEMLSGTRINHATIFRRSVEEGLIDPKRVVQVGLRGSRFSPGDVEWGEDQGFTCMTIDKFEAMGRDAAISEIVRVTGAGPTYVTIDIDGLDPSFAPGTGVPEIGGLSPRDVQLILRALRGKHLIGGDICEVAPAFDPTGITAITAANLMWEMLCVFADNRRRPVSIT